MGGTKLFPWTFKCSRLRRVSFVFKWIYNYLIVILLKYLCFPIYYGEKIEMTTSGLFKSIHWKYFFTRDIYNLVLLKQYNWFYTVKEKYRDSWLKHSYIGDKSRVELICLFACKGFLSRVELNDRKIECFIQIEWNELPQIHTLHQGNKFLSLVCSLFDLWSHGLDLSLLEI